MQKQTKTEQRITYSLPFCTDYDEKKKRLQTELHFILCSENLVFIKTKLSIFCRWLSAKGSSGHSNFPFPLSRSSGHTQLRRNRCCITSLFKVGIACIFLLFLVFLFVHICIAIQLYVLSRAFLFFLSFYYVPQLCRYIFSFCPSL